MAPTKSTVVLTRRAKQSADQSAAAAAATPASPNEATMSGKGTVTITPKREREEGPPVSASGCALPIEAGGHSVG